MSVDYISITVDYTAAAPGALQFTSATFSQAENVATANLTVSRTGGSLGAVSVQCANAGTGTATVTTDYTMTTPQILNWADADTADKNCVVTIVNDTRDELDETVNALLQSVSGGATIGAQSTTALTITDDDPTPTVTFTAGSQSSASETGTMTITAQLSAASNLTVTVPFTVNASSTATSVTDYSISASPLTINPGATTATITITIAGDTRDENNETVVVNMGTPTNATQGATIAHTATITDDDPTPTVQWTAASQASANEVNATTMIVTAQLSAVSGLNVSVPFTPTGTATGGGTDYTITASPIAINAGSTTGTATITIVGDVAAEGNETVILTIGSPTNASAVGTTVHTATITDDDGPVCTQNPMTITVTPATQNVRAGFAITYTVMVTNNDSVECSNLTVNLGVVDNPVTPTANFALSTLSAASRVIAPQSSSNVTLTVTAQGAGVETSTLTSTFTATATGHVAQNDTAVSTIMNYNPMIHSSKSTNSTKWAGNGGWGIAGGKYGEFTCATCHVKGTGNIKRVKTSIDTPNTDPWVGSNTQTVAVTLSATTGANSYGNDGRATLTSSNMVCEVCHSATTVHRYNSSTGVTDFNHMDGNQGDCISCHAHNKGFDASCTTCHGYPPVDAGTLVIVTSRPTGSLTAGAHNTHVATFSISCAVCHFNSNGSGATHNVNGQVSLGFVNLPTGTGGVSSGSYNGQGTVTYNSTDAGTTVSSGGTKTCTNYCHGSTIGAAGAVWDNPATADCGDCHGAAVATPPTRVNHPRHVGTAAGQLGLTCDKCHGPGYAGGLAPGGHLSGSVTYDVSTLTGNTPTYRGFSTVQQTGTLAPSGTYGNCGNMYCHSNVQSVNGTAAASVYATPTWGAASVACDSCHGQAGRGDGQPNTGSHEIHATTRGYVCSVCHAGAGDEAAVHANGLINISLSGGGTYTQGNHAPGAGGYGTCSSVACHNGKTTLTWGNNTGGCILCHTVDGTNSATVANPVSGLHSNTVASVQDHDNTLAGSCEACHVKASIAGHWDGVASVTADYTKAAVGITAAMYTDAGGVLATRGTCMGTSDLTSCHTDKGNWRRQWSTNADVDIVTGSKLPGQAVCNVCHGQYSGIGSSTGWNEGTVHYRSSDLADPWNENKGIIHADAGDECEDCHGYDSVAVHNSNNKIDFSDSGNPGGYAVTLNATPNPDVWYCATCHTSQNAQVATLTGSHTFLDSLAFPNATNPINHVVGTSIPQGSCFGCHGDGAAEYWPQNTGNVRGSTTMADYNNAGAHQKHIEVIAARIGGITLPGDDTQQKAMCAYCHTVADGDHMTTGVSELAEVYPVGGKKSLWNGTDSDAAFVNSGNYNCTTTDCHNSKDTAATYGWYSGGTSTCIMCHTVGGTNSATTAHPSSGIHDAARITGRLHDDSFAYGTNGASTANCVTCHTATPTTGTNQHISGVNDYSIGVADAVDPKVNLAVAVGFVDAVVPTCAPTQANGCHIEQWNAVTDHTWTHQWHESAGLSTGAECRGCHGTFTQNWQAGVTPVHTTNFDGQADGAEVRLNHDHGAGTETEYNQCISCHVYNDALYGALGWNPTAGNNHGNGQIEMLTSMGYTIASNTCSNNCHGTEVGSHAMIPDSGWTVANLVGPALVCTGCHTGSGSGALKVGSASSHVIRGTKAGMNTFNSCADCHPEHSGGLLIPNNTNVGINYTAGGRTGFRLGGTAATGATEAEICWTCHSDTTTYQTTVISEWGINNKQAGTPAPVTAYDYGQIYTTNTYATVDNNWIGAYWKSAVVNFDYKKNIIASTHAANSAATVPGVDAVGDIRCSYCHDVHDTASGIVTGDKTGKPFLRGTWWTNPYREDGAPVLAITYTGVAPFGNVPRASSTQNQLGGYQIDQNNGSPTATGGTGTGGAWTVADSAGLCWLCHNKNKAGTNVTVDTLDWFGTNDWVTNGSGQINGHSNAVVGGTGSNRVNIFRSSWRAPSLGLTTTGARPDMGYANHGSLEGYGYRAVDGRGFNGHSPLTNASDSRPYGGSFYSWGATVDDTTTDTKYHNFSCSKCHNPHASRLPRLMVTNCLDTKKNTWDNVRTGITALSVAGDTNSNNVLLSATTAPDSWGRTWSNVQSAQNCHRLADPAVNPTNTTNYGKGWNNVTPW